MSIPQSDTRKPSAAPNAWTLDLEVENCPTCDQPIPHARFEEIKETIRGRQAEQATHIAASLREHFGREKAEALEEANRKAAAELASAIESARSEERSAAEKDSTRKFDDLRRASEEAQSALKAKIRESETAKIAADEAGNDLRAQLEQTRLDHAAEVQKVKEEAETTAATIRADAAKAAEAAFQEKLAEVERLRHSSESALQARIAKIESEKNLAEQSGNALRAELDQTRNDHAAAFQTMKEEAEANAAVIRASAARDAKAAVHLQISEMERGRQETETVLQAKIADAEQATAAADARAKALEVEVQRLNDTHESNLAQRLNEQREALEKAQTDAANAQKAASFQKELKLQEKVDQLQRALDNKTAEELGEGAEIDLYELLKGEFEVDRVERINRGQPGADILHTVILNGKECGSIIYDSKNHNAWRNDFLTKLAADQLAAKAEHAILSTRKFPAGHRHLHVHDGVILAAPSRILAIATILRQHIVQTHTLRCSSEARLQKTAALYDFINSERCRDLFKRVDTHADRLLELQVKEKRAHEAHWKTQGEMIRSVQKVQAEILNEIDCIVGTAEKYERAAHE